VAVAYDVPADGAMVLCDRDYVTQVLVGFVDNAIKHTPSGGIVTLGLTPDGDGVTFCVKDTGSGIPLEVLPHIFDRFYTQRKTAEGGHRGSGLGLAIAHEIVEAHGSDIDVRSAPGQGTSFCFTLRRAE
jgi:signal transduction histidine kinase